MKKLYIFKEDLRMANETLKAGFDKYMAEADAKCAKFPERENLEPNRLYTPLDLEGFDYERDLGFPGEYPFTPWRTAHDVSWPFLDDAYVCWLLHC
jgi:hypothetical protein